MDIAWGDPKANIAKAEALMNGCEADLYVLPEMWATGFAVHPEKIAEDEETSIALTWMKAIAHERQCAVSGSLAIRDATGSYRNRLYFISPEGVTHYDKHHLFTFAGEDQHYMRGDETVVVNYRGWRLLLLVCYDLRFPVWSRWGRRRLTSANGSASETAELVYDAIIYVANWPDARQEAWDTLLRARAIENQCYVVAVNRVGTERKLDFSGGSVIVDPLGRVVCACHAEEKAVMAEIEINNIKVQREIFPVLQDRDRC